MSNGIEPEQPMDWPDITQVMEGIAQQQLDGRSFYQEQPVFRDRTGVVVETGDVVQCFNHEQHGWTANDDVVYEGTIVFLYLEYPTGSGRESHIAIVKAEPNSWQGQLCYCDSLQLVKRGPRNTIEDVPEHALSEELKEVLNPGNEPTMNDLKRLEELQRVYPADTPILPSELRGWVDGKCPTTNLPREQVDPKEYE